MDAAPIQTRIAELLNRHGLEAVTVGNAAAALNGAPVTTVDIDFSFLRTPANIEKIEAIGVELKAVVLRRFDPVDDLFRIMRDQDTLQIDFMPTVEGLSSFEGLRKRSAKVDFDGHSLNAASLTDIIKSKKAAGRPKDLAVMYVLENTLAEKRLQERRNLKRSRRTVKLPTAR